MFEFTLAELIADSVTVFMSVIYFVVTAISNLVIVIYTHPVISLVSIVVLTVASKLFFWFKKQLY